MQTVALCSPRSSARLTCFARAGEVAVRASSEDRQGSLARYIPRRSSWRGVSWRVVSCHRPSLVVMSYHYQKNEPGGYEDAYDMVSW